MLHTSLSSGVRVVTSNTKETTIATAATFIDTNGSDSDSGGGIHRSAISGMATRLTQSILLTQRVT